MGRPARTTAFEEQGISVLPQAATPIAYRVPEAARIVGVSASKMWALIARQEIVARKLGGSTVIRHADLVAYVDGAPVAERANAAQASMR